MSYIKLDIYQIEQIADQIHAEAAACQKSIDRMTELMSQLRTHWEGPSAAGLCQFYHKIEPFHYHTVESLHQLAELIQDTARAHWTWEKELYEKLIHTPTPFDKEGI